MPVCLLMILLLLLLLLNCICGCICGAMFIIALVGDIPTRLPGTIPAISWGGTDNVGFIVVVESGVAATLLVLVVVVVVACVGAGVFFALDTDFFCLGLRGFLAVVVVVFVEVVAGVAAAAEAAVGVLMAFKGLFTLAADPRPFFAVVVVVVLVLFVVVAVGLLVDLFDKSFVTDVCRMCVGANVSKG